MTAGFICSGEARTYGKPLDGSRRPGHGVRGAAANAPTAALG